MLSHARIIPKPHISELKHIFLFPPYKRQQKPTHAIFYLKQLTLD